MVLIKMVHITKGVCAALLLRSCLIRNFKVDEEIADVKTHKETVLLHPSTPCWSAVLSCTVQKPACCRFGALCLAENWNI